MTSTTRSNFDGTVLFSDTIGINVNVEGMSGSRKVSLDNVEVDADKDRLRLASKILQCEEMAAIKGLFSQVRANMSDPRRGVALPTLFKRGAYLLRRSKVQEVENMLREHQQTLTGLVANLKAVYEQRIAEDRAKLREKFDTRHYPAIDALDDTFKIKWSYQSVAPTLDLQDISADIYQAEVARVTAEVNVMAAEIVSTLRATALELVHKLADALDGKDESGKKKTLRGSQVRNLVSFLTSFEDKNVMGDRELGDTLRAMRDVLSGVADPSELRDNDALRARVQESLADALPKLSNLVATSGRVVELPDDEPTIDDGTQNPEAGSAPETAEPVEHCKKHKAETKPCMKCKAESQKRSKKAAA